MIEALKKEYRVAWNKGQKLDKLYYDEGVSEAWANKQDSMEKNELKRKKQIEELKNKIKKESDQIEKLKKFKKKMKTQLQGIGDINGDINDDIKFENKTLADLRRKVKSYRF